MIDVMASLLAVCLLEVNGDVHQLKDDNYLFREYVCSADNNPLELDCGQIKGLFELEQQLTPIFILSPEIEEILKEIYERCCKEA